MAALVLGGLVAWAVALMLAGCGGGAPEVTEAHKGLVRVELARLSLPDAPRTIAERVKRYEALLGVALEIEAYDIAGDIETHWASDLEAEQKLPEAREHYVQALRDDKRAHARNREAQSPEAAAVAISLMNLSLIEEKLGNAPEALGYAERAYAINSALRLARREAQDLKRLATLYDDAGDADNARRVRAALKLVNVRLASAARGPELTGPSATGSGPASNAPPAGD